ncbi:MAG: hypothetical protein P9L91_04200 [Candidatus Zophobacter franzmannii]|nr:hypothetical protein [Candidatus Zophobacter franzmannii]
MSSQILYISQSLSHLFFYFKSFGLIYNGSGIDEDTSQKKKKSQ